MTTEKPNNKAGLEHAIERALQTMDNEDPTSDQYAKVVDQLQKLHEMKTTESKPRVSAETALTIGANLLGILMIVGHERTHIVTSKALGFVLKLR